MSKCQSTSYDDYNSLKSSRANTFRVSLGWLERTEAQRTLRLDGARRALEHVLTLQLICECDVCRVHESVVRRPGQEDVTQTSSHRSIVPLSSTFFKQTMWSIQGSICRLDMVHTLNSGQVDAQIQYHDVGNIRDLLILDAIRGIEDGIQRWIPQRL